MSSDILSVRTSILQQTFSYSVFITSKWSAAEASASQSSKWRVWLKKLSLYYEKTIKKHLNWIRDAHTVFYFSSENFSTEKNKVLYVMQYLAGESKNTWYCHKKMLDWDTLIWAYFEKFLLNIIENSVNHQLNAHQLYISAIQQSHQSVHSFEAYLSNLKTQLLSIEKVYLMMNFFTRLWVDLQTVLTNYQDLSTTQNSLMTLAAQLESNLWEESTSKTKHSQSFKTTDKKK